MEINQILERHTAIFNTHDTKTAIDLIAQDLRSMDLEPDEEIDDQVYQVYYYKHGELIPDVGIGEEFELKKCLVNNPTETWSWAGDFAVMFPSSLRGIVNGVKYALENDCKIRCLGRKYSFSLVCENGPMQIYIDLCKTFTYNIRNHNEEVKKLDVRSIFRLKDSVDQEKYFPALGGMPVYMINHILCPDNEHHEALFGPKRMYNMAGVDEQTIAGAISTGTHGTGGRFTAYHDMVRSIELVASDGTVYRIEPTDGITDPEKHQTFYEENPDEVPVLLLQDDDKFHAALVNMGCFGIIYSVIIEVAPLTLMHQDVAYSEYGYTDTLKEEIKSGFLPEDPEEEYFYSLLINPYKVEDDKPRSIAYKITKPTDERQAKGGARRRKFWPTFFANIGIAIDIIRHIANAGNYPKPKFIEASLKAQEDIGEDGGGYTGLPYKAWNGGIGKLKSFGVGIEFCLPVDQVPENLDKVLDMLEGLGDRGRGFFLNSAINLRFARPSKALLANNYYLDKDGNEVKEWCHVEIIRVSGVNDEQDARELELLENLQKMFTTFGARPHWGLNFEYEFSIGILRELYPKFDIWWEAYAFFNEKGIFSNAFTERAGIDEILKGNNGGEPPIAD